MKGKNSAAAGKAEAAASSEETDDQVYNFHFVEVGEPSQGRIDDYRSTIRSHVMRDYYEKKDSRRQPSTLSGSGSASPETGAVLQQTHRFKVGPQGLQEVKSGRRKRKGGSRATKRVANVPKNISEPEEIQVQTHSSQRAPNSDQPESATFTLSDHQHRQAEVKTSKDGQCPAAESEILIGNAPLPLQFKVGSRNITPPNTIPPTAGVIDPFKWLPVLCAPRTQLLLYHGKSLLGIIRQLNQFV
jgi:hypothetical protein